MLPHKGELLKQIKAAGSVKQYAIAIGVDETTLRRHITKAGWSDDVREALKKVPRKFVAPEPSVSGQSKHAYPPDEQLIAECIAAGGKSQYAGQLGIANATLQQYIKRQGLTDQINEALRNPLVKTIGEEVTEVEKLQAEVRELTTALSRARGSEVAESRVIDAIEKGVKAAKVSYRANPHSRKVSSDPHTLALLLSDLHAGEVVSLEETNGLNEYNWAVMLERLRTLAQGIRSHSEHYGMARARKLHIFSLGDQLSGVAHEELRESNNPPFAEAIVRLGEDLGEWIASELVEEFPDGIEMDCVVGNHPRFSQKPRAKIAYDNGDWITANVTRTYLRQYKNVTIRAPKAAQAVVEVCGRKVLLVHGDGVRTTMAGVPWGGIIRQSDRLRALFGLSDVQVETVCCGHWHNPQIAEDWSILVNGSLKGVDEYSIKKYGGGKPPSQLLVAFHPKHGLTSAHRIEV